MIGHFKAFLRWLFRYRGYPLSSFPSFPPDPSVERTSEELRDERRRHLEEEDRLRRLEYLYMQQQVMRRQKNQEGEGGE